MGIPGGGAWPQGAPGWCSHFVLLPTEQDVCSLGGQATCHWGAVLTAPETLNSTPDSVWTPLDMRQMPPGSTESQRAWFVMHLVPLSPPQSHLIQTQLPEGVLHHPSSQNKKPKLR